MSYKPGEKIEGTNVFYHGAGIYQFEPVEQTPEQQAENNRRMEELRKRINEAKKRFGLDQQDGDEVNGTHAQD